MHPYPPPPPQVPEISPNELRSRLEHDPEPPFMLDVREPEEWVEGHIDGATLIPLGELAARQAEIPTDREIVAICRSGQRSAHATDALGRAGYRAVNLSGGMLAWARERLPITRGD